MWRYKNVKNPSNIDPKRELRNHYQEVINSPEFARLYPERKKQIENFNFVTLDSSLPSNHGVLDPIVVLDKEQAVEVAKNMLDFSYKLSMT